MKNGGLLSSLQEGGLHDVLFENVHIKIATWSNYSRSAAGGKTGLVGPGWPGGVMCGRDPVICGSDNKTCAGQGDGSEAAELPCFGTHDYRPHNGGDCAPFRSPHFCAAFC